MSRIWERLAEAVGIKDAVNWSSVNKRQNMARYGSMDRRDRQGPMAYFNTKGTGAAQGGMRPPIRPDPGIQRQGMQIPGGTDRPGQDNPLMRPSPLSTSANAPRRSDPMASALAGDEEDEAYEGLKVSERVRRTRPASRRR